MNIKFSSLYLSMISSCTLIFEAISYEVCVTGMLSKLSRDSSTSLTSSSGISSGLRSEKYSSLMLAMMSLSNSTFCSSAFSV